ncbi:hypothetical protein VB735_29810 [Halotia wernerae UHCC 0503]|nr:hypothetical protein [Halotia wernerae UHCC 0503]
MTLAGKFFRSKSSLIVGLSSAIALLAAVAASIGLFWQDGGQSFSFTTLHGQTVQIYGQGLYRYDTLFSAAGSRGTDAVTLFLAIPLLIICLSFYRRGSLRGALLLIGALFYFLYVYAGFALGTVTYNRLFLLYVVLFSISLFTFVFALTTIDLQHLALCGATNLNWLNVVSVARQTGWAILLVRCPFLRAIQLHCLCPCVAAQLGISILPGTRDAECVFADWFSCKY